MKISGLRDIIRFGALLLGLGVGLAIMADPITVTPAEEVQVDQLEQRRKSLMAMDAQAQRAEIEKMSADDARTLRDFLRTRAIQADGSSASVFYLYEHLAGIAAIDLAEKRMQKLVLVFVVTLGLFSGFLVYLLIVQNRLTRRLQDGSPPSEKSGSPVYRGE